jgi:hypothetical protein
MTRRKSTSLVAALFAPGTAFLIAGAAMGEKKPAPMAVVAGTVFRDSSFALAGAEVTVAEAGETSAKKKKKWSAPTDSRGEFAIRVPPAPDGGYNVSVKAIGFEAQAKTVKPQEGERVEINFVLSASK